MKHGDKGSGGVAILVRKGLGTVEEVKTKGIEGLLWAKIKCEGRTLIVAAVYLVPIGSRYYEKNYNIREQLEKDIGMFKQQGIVIVVGDMNSRIGN